MLRLVEPDLGATRLADLCTEDRDRLLAIAQRKAGRSYERPCDALDDLFALLGWRVDRLPINSPEWALCDPWTRSVTVCTRLRAKMRFPASEAGARNFTLGHELAHVRLHLSEVRAGKLTDVHEREADLYAGIFLMPTRLLASQPEFRALRRGLTSDQLWEQVRVLAMRLGVTGHACAVRLAELGLVLLDPVSLRLRAA